MGINSRAGQHKGPCGTTTCDATYLVHQPSTQMFAAESLGSMCMVLVDHLLVS